MYKERSAIKFMARQAQDSYIEAVKFNDGKENTGDLKSSASNQEIKTESRGRKERKITNKKKIERKKVKKSRIKKR